MKTFPFIGRSEELKKLQGLTKKKSSSLIVIRGRRRVGKSRLVQEFGEKYRFLRFSGLPPTEQATAQSERDEFARQLSLATGLPEMIADDWNKLFQLLARECKEGRVVILFDEISWMGSKDPDFLGKLKNAWDLHLKENAELILILCGSVSTWIEKNILSSTGFLGRISLELELKELTLRECNQFLNEIGFRGSEYEKLKILSVTGGIPKYLEEIRPDLPAEENIRALCFVKEGLLFREFDNIFSDLFSRRSSTYKDIVKTLIGGAKEFNEIANKANLKNGGYLTECLDDLIKSGFLTRDHTWEIKHVKELGLSHYRLSDNYLRFYLKYIEPNRNKIKQGQFDNKSLTTLTSWDTIMGLQFENLVLNNRNLIWEKLSIRPEDIVNNNPFFQRKTTRTKGCQIDYLIQTRLNVLYACEIKFYKQEIKSNVINEVKEKIKRLSLPRGFSCWPVLIHVNGVEESLKDQEYFVEIVDVSELLS